MRNKRESMAAQDEGEGADEIVIEGGCIHLRDPYRCEICRFRRLQRNRLISALFALAISAAAVAGLVMMWS